MSSTTHVTSKPVYSYFVVTGLLVMAFLASLWIQSQSDPSAPDVSGLETLEAGPTGKAYFVDTEGWYQITQNERVVMSPIAWGLEALPASLPMQLGNWIGAELPLGPEINEWFDHPEVAIQREYHNEQGDIVWLSVFASRGSKSFRLFEHTPSTCYPLSGWEMTHEDITQIQVGNGEIYANRGFARNISHELIVFYLYLWDNPARDPIDGVISMRISAPVMRTETDTLRLIKDDFLPIIFTDVVPWHRF